MEKKKQLGKHVDKLCAMCYKIKKKEGKNKHSVVLLNFSP